MEKDTRVGSERSWSPGFWERMHRLATEVDIEVPEPLPETPYRDAAIDELAEPSNSPPGRGEEAGVARGWPPGFWERFDSLGPLPEDFRRPDPLPRSEYRERLLSEFDKL